MSDQSCPQSVMLGRFLVGALDDQEAKPIEEHLLRCDECAAKADTLRPSDTVLELARGYNPPTDDTEQIIDRIIHRSIQDAASSCSAIVIDVDNSARAQGGLYERLAGIAHDRADKVEPSVTDAAERDYDFLAPPEAEDEIGRLGHYRILKVLGSGGMGIVFLAQDLDLKRLVALKAMHPALAASKSARDRFMREAQAAAALDHDNVVTIHHVGRDRDIPFLAMPLLRGKTLEECLVPGRAFPVEKVVRIGREICQGLAAAHAQGLIHRDIKPGNIWLEEGTDRVKILDFGLARSADSETHLTRPGTIVGTPAFMSPEQARSETVDARSDLFSLGCLLYVMSTGEPAFIGPNNAAILAAVEKENPLPPRKLKPQVPGELSDVIMRLLAKDREQRPESAAAVIESLRQIDEASDQQRAVTSFPVGQIESPVAVAQNDVQSASRNRTGSKWMFDSRVLRTLAVALGLIAMLGTYAAYTVVVHLSNGRLVVEASDKDVEISIQREGDEPVVKVIDRQTSRQIYLKPGDYEIDVTIKDGDSETQFITKSLSLKRGEREILNVSLELAKLERSSPAKRDSLAPSSATIVEPPALAEYLRGREVITVAQDSSGDFRTIKEGLEKAKPGQVVMVLDKGPYRERWTLLTLSGDVGLVSEVGTQIDLSDLLKLEGNDEQPQHFRYRGSDLVCPGDFRISGFEFVHPGFPEDAFGGESFIIWARGSTTVENCRFEQAPGQLPFDANANPPRPWFLGLVIGSHEGKPSGPFSVRNCRVDGLQCEGQPTSVLVEDNWIVHKNLTGISLVTQRGDVTVRHNVIQGDTGIHYFLAANDQRPEANDAHISISNNFFESRVASFSVLEPEAGHHLPMPQDVRIKNNIMRSETAEFIVFNTQELFDFAEDHWQVGTNCLNKEPRTLTPEWPVIKQRATDVVVASPFLSDDADDPNYLRIPADSKLASAGAGGDLPGYIGPFPPGPAPKEGDWLTRIQDLEVRGSVLPTVEELLKTREVLTVAQDGSGDYKTIQSALDNVKVGQVVQVLDKGPYREFTDKNLPADVALVSLVGTRIEIPKYEPYGDASEDGKFPHQGSVLRVQPNFRLSGFEWVGAAPRPENLSGGSLLYLDATGDMVVERCSFQGPDNMDGLHCFTTSDKPAQLLVQDNISNQALEFSGRRGSLTVQRNWISTSGWGMRFYHRAGSVVIRNNVVSASWGISLDIGPVDKALPMPGVDSEIHNNVLDVASCPIGFLNESTDRVLPRSTWIANNIFRCRNNDGILIVSKDGALVKDRWNVGPNVYQTVPKNTPGSPLESWPISSRDLILAQQFLSVDSNEPDYFRIAADGPLASGGAGGELPSYFGAFPPGPAPKDGDWFTRLIRDMASNDDTSGLEVRQ